MQSFGKLIQTTFLKRSLNPSFARVAMRFDHHTYKDPMQDNAWDYAVKARVTKPAPRFEGMAWVNNEIKKISLDDYKGKYVVLFFYPLDFTFVCPTEIK